MHNIVLTTAEDIVSVVDAVVAKGQNATKGFISDFTGIATDDQVNKAIQMAIELRLIYHDEAADTYGIQLFLARNLVTASSDEQKAVIMRVILEQYEPYITFRTRYAYTKNLEIACKQMKTLYSMASNERDIKNTLVSIATYAKALRSEGANLYSFDTDDAAIDIIKGNLQLAARIGDNLRSFFGEAVCLIINRENTLQPLLDAFQKTRAETIDARAVVVYSANAFESFLDDWATKNAISLSGRRGIGQKKDALASCIGKKHRGMIEYIAQVRNAADHGSDPDDEHLMWSISEETAILYPRVIACAIKSICLRENGMATI